MAKIEGRCLCGSVTYTCDADPIATAVCHCADCQRQTGTSFSIIVAVPKSAFAVSGDTLATWKTVGEDHGRETERNFCSRCGSPVYSWNPGMPDAALIKAGTLDDRSWLDPQLELWGGSAQPWVEAVAGRTRLERGLPS